MGFLFKLIVYTLVFSFIVYVFKMIARLTHNVRATVKDMGKLRENMQAAAQGRPTVSAEMVRCRACGSFVATKEAVTVSARQGKDTFCSHECMRQHAV